jgi:hypothetical protein
VYIEVRDKDKPTAKKLAEGQLSVEEFLKSAGSHVDVPVHIKET